MLRRALLAAAAFSCLICVLVMNGLQKEDLDVSLLRKLQRYNVNIGDMDNENVQHECSTKNKGLPGVNKNKNDDILISTSERTTVTSSTAEPTSERDQLKDLDTDAVLNFFKSRKKTLYKLYETTTEKYVHIQKKVTPQTEYQEDPTKGDLNLLQKYIQLQATNKLDIPYDNSNNNVLIKGLFPKKLIVDEFIGNVLNSYIMQKEVPSTRTEYTTITYPNSIQNIYKQINDLITNGSKSNIETENANDILHNFATNNNEPKDSTDIFKLTQTDPRFDRVNPKTKSFYNFLNVMNQFRTYSSIVLNQNNTPVFSNPYKTEVEPHLLSTTTSNNKKEYYDEVSANKSQTKLEPKQKIVSSNLVQEIAESVKNVIIQDLRKELSDIYVKTTQSTSMTTSTSTTTTEAPTTNINVIGSKEKEKNIMEAFMELYNQIKSFKQTFVFGEQKKTENTLKNYRQNLKMPTLQRIVKDPQVDSLFLPTFDRFNDPKQQIVVSSDHQYGTKQFVNINSFYPRQIKRHQSPITIQTNSVEIKPLAIPVTNPESLIRQNIIISSKQIIHSREDNLDRTISKQNRYLDVRANQLSSIRQHTAYNSAPQTNYGYQDPFDREDVIRFRMRNSGDSKLDTDYYEKINLENYNNKRNRPSGYDQIPDIPRFHERLERINDRVPAFYDKDNIGKDYRYLTMSKGIGTEKQAIDKIASRNQMSLVDMKKGSSFDDTHFKNFLKTQQKVTDILERILAKKPHTNTPPIVEIT